MSEELEARIRKLEEIVVFLSHQKCNANAFQWLNYRVGQVDRRIDRLVNALGWDDNWDGDLNFPS